MLKSNLSVEEDDGVLFPSALEPNLVEEEDDGVLFPSALPENELFPSESSSQQATSELNEFYPLSHHQEQHHLSTHMDYERKGNAIDIVLVEAQDGTFHSTPWHVAMSWSRFRSSLSAGVGDSIEVFVNGVRLQTDMILEDRGRCKFPQGKFVPPMQDFMHVPLNKGESNYVRFEHHRRNSSAIRYTDCYLHVWDANDSVMVVDLDGTITISDIEGHIRTLRLGQHDFIHHGACEFFTKIQELGCRILYLTARPIDWASASREHLEKVRQGPFGLPSGPLITNSGGLRTSLVAEVVNKNPNVFKAGVLNEIQLCLIEGGRNTNFPLFVAGFGNRPTDVIAYEEVGIEKEMIFIVDKLSVLKIAVDDPFKPKNPNEPYVESSNIYGERVFQSYSDPRSLLYLLSRMKYKMPIKYAEKIDMFAARELVLADEQEQQRLFELSERKRIEEEHQQQLQRQLTASDLSAAGLSPSTAYYGARHMN